MQTRILLTGSSGFIGRRTQAVLERQGHLVTGLSSRDGHIARDPLPEVEADRVVHLAGLGFVPDSWKDPAAYYEVNTQGTARVLDWCRTHGASLTYVSSYIYGEPRYLPIDEEHPPAPTNPYAHSKLLAEQLCQFYAANFGVKVCIVRPFNVYGPGQRGAWLIPTLIEQALRTDSDFISVADDRPRRDFVYVDDLADLLAATCGRDATGVYNCASGDSVSIGELAEMLGWFTAPKKLQSRGERRAGEMLDVRGDASKAQRELAWEARVPIEDGLRRTVQASRAAGSV